MTRDELIARGREALARGQYFEAHEHWEDAWRATDGAEKPVVQALAQLAAALVHVTRGNTIGATRVLDKVRAKLVDAPAMVGGVAVSAIHRLIDELTAGLAGDRPLDLAAITL